MPLTEAKSLLRRISDNTQTYRPDPRTHPRTQHAEMSRGGVQQIASGQPSEHAPKLRSSKTSFHIFEHDPVADRVALESLAQSLDEFSPIIGLEQPTEKGVPPECILMEVTGLSHLFGDESRLAMGVTEFCHQRGYHTQTAIANTPGVAWGASHWLDFSESKSHIAVLAAQETATFAALPVQALRLSQATTDTLTQLGIDCIDRLQRIPRADLTSRFGDEIHMRLDQATGVVNEPIISLQKPAEYSAEKFLEFPIQDRETIEVILTRLVTDICRQMRVDQKGALQWTIRLNCQSGPPIQFSVQLFQPTATARHVMQLVEMQLETALKPHTKKRKAYSRKRTSAPTTTGSNIEAEPSTPNKKSGGGIPIKQDSHSVYRANTPANRSHSGGGSNIPGNQDSYSVSGASTPANQHSYSASGTDTPDNQHSYSASGTDTPPNQDSYSVGGADIPVCQATPPKYHRRTTILIHEIIVNVTTSVLLVERQRQLFDENPRLDKQALSHLINRLTSRLGQENIVYPTLQSGAQPEYSIRFRPLVNVRRRGARKPAKPKENSHVMSRPLRLLNPPLQLEHPERNKTTIPASRNKQSPIGLSIGNASVIQALGPERIETGWWRGPTTRRDYWRVATDTFRQYWVYCDLKTRQWFLHGEF